MLEFDAEKDEITLEVTVLPTEKRSESDGVDSGGEEGDDGSSVLGNGIVGIEIMDMKWRDIMDPLLMCLDG